MRDVDGVYGGEMSAHHYFRDFAYCDSGMIPWLLVTAGHERHRQDAVAAGGRAHAAVPGERRDQPARAGRARRPSPRCSRSTSRARSASTTPTASASSSTSWRFNLRSSNTEPLIRLNVESRGDEALMREKTAELLRWSAASRARGHSLFRDRGLSPDSSGSLTGPGLPLNYAPLGWAVSSAVEHCFHTAGVTGSIPVPPTTLERFAPFACLDITYRTAARCRASTRTPGWQPTFAVRGRHGSGRACSRAARSGQRLARFRHALR